MNPTALFLAALVIVPALGMVTLALFAMAQVERQLQSFSGFEGLHLES